MQQIIGVDAFPIRRPATIRSILGLIEAKVDNGEFGSDDKLPKPDDLAFYLDQLREGIKNGDIEPVKRTITPEMIRVVFGESPHVSRQADGTYVITIPKPAVVAGT